MNKSTAKRLRNLARTICEIQGIKISEGYNEYNQIENCASWEPAYADGHTHDWDDPDNNKGHIRVTDPEGTPLIGLIKRPGTIQTVWKFRTVYQNLKRLWKQTNGKHEVFNADHV